MRTLWGVVRLRLKIRRCYNSECERCGCTYRPEAEGKWALPQHEFGLDVIALCGALRYQQQRSVSEIHQQLQQRGLCVSQRSVSHLLKRYDELLALGLSDKKRIQKIVEGQKRVILAIDGMQPDVGHEVLWVLRDCLPLRNSTGSNSTICENSRFSRSASRGEAGCSCTNCWSYQ